MLEYRIMKQDDKTSDTPESVARAKQSCTREGTLEQSLTVQKLVFIKRDERASFYIQFHTLFQTYLSVCYFGIFEV